MSIFDLSNGETAQTGGTADSGGGNFEPIPDGTKLIAMITEVGWKEFDDDKFISIRWDVLQGEYKGRLVFQKVRVLNSNADKRDRQIKMLAAIDENSGGKLAGLGKSRMEDLSDHEMTKALSNTPMEIQVREWKIDKDRQGNPLPESEIKKGNWVSAVAGKNASRNANQKTEQPKQQEPQSTNAENDAEIPF